MWGGGMPDDITVVALRVINKADSTSAVSYGRARVRSGGRAGGWAAPRSCGRVLVSTRGVRRELLARAEERRRRQR